MIPKTAARQIITEPRKYVGLAKKKGWQNADKFVWLISINNLLRYIAFSCEKGNQPTTIFTYLSTLAKAHAYKGFFNWQEEVQMHPIIKTATENLWSNHQFVLVKQKNPSQ